MSEESESPRNVAAVILLAALGYFVDIYDLILFSIVRVASLKGIGDPESELLDTGVFLINWQMAGMLLGGILWGVLGDKKGRLSVLFGSIIMYSAANIANGFVNSVPAYAALRFIAGIGLAGELGAGITLVSEIMSKESRGYGTMIVAGTGIFGGVAGGLIGDYFPWRTAYFIGGGMGFALLILRLGVYESGMFERVLSRADVRRGDFRTLFATKDRLFRYANCILLGMPIWFIIGILATFSPELGKALEMPELPKAGRAVLWLYLGCAIGDFASGGLSQLLKSRRKAAFVFVGGCVVTVGLLLTARGATTSYFYAVIGAMGFFTGYWAVFMTIASEQFGTNIRATVTTTVPNFVRGALVPISTGFQALKAGLGVVGAASAVGAITFAMAFFALAKLKETYGKDLNYLED